MDTSASALDTSPSALVPSGLEVTVDHDTSKSELAILEATLSPSELERYNRRLKEGFNLDIDEVYLQWKRLKTAVSQACGNGSENSVSTSPHKYTSSGLSRANLSVCLPSKSVAGSSSSATMLPTTSTPASKTSTSKVVSPPFHEVLVYPKAKPVRKGKTRTA